MNRLRSGITARIVAGFLVASLLPLLVSVPESFAVQGEEQSHDEWLKSLLRTQPSETVSSAIAEASAHEHATQRDFLVSFVKAFEAQKSGESLPSFFTHMSVSNDELILLLQGELTGIGTDVFAVQTSIRAVTPGSLGSVRPLFEAAHRADKHVAERQLSRSEANCNSATVQTNDGWLTARQPLGP